MPPRFTRRILAPWVLASLTTLGVPIALHAQDTGAKGSDAGVRAAGNEARFRVIERFKPAEAASKQQPDAPWPFPETAREAVIREDWEAALAAMKGAKSAELSDEFRFLKGYVAHRAGDHANAVDLLTSVANASELLADHARFYAAKSAFDAGRFDVAAGLAARIADEGPLRAPAALLMATALIRDGKAEQGMRGLRGYLSRWSNGSSAAEARLTLADALVEAGKIDEAADLYATIRWRHPLTTQRGDAERRLDAIREKLSEATKKKLASPSPDDLLSEQRERFAAHQSKTVVGALPELLEGWKRGSEERCEALYLVARSHTKLRHHGEASPWYERLVDECPDSKWQLKALYLGGKGFWNEGKRDKAAAWFEKLWTDYPDHSFADDAIYFTARIRREAEDDKAARKLLKRQVEKYPTGDMATDAHWLLVRQMFADGEHQKAVEYVDGLKERGENDLYTAGRLEYFRGRALQKLEKQEQAREGFLRVAKAHPLSYYALLALNRLHEMDASDEEAGGEDLCAGPLKETCARLRADALSSIAVPDKLREETAFERGMIFLDLELDDLAEGEFRRLERHLKDDPEQLWTLAWLLHRASAYPLSHDIPRRRIEEWKTSYPKSEEDPKWTVAYPVPFAEVVKSWSKRRNLPPALIYAIMREESGFNPRVKSWAGAHGLMQLMPSTAKTVAEAEGIALEEAELYEPDTAIRLGSAYLADLAGKVQNHPVLTIAGYNAGWGNLSSWLGDDDAKDLDLWVEDIPFGQTRHYAKRVTQTYWIYNWLYGEAPVPRLALTLP